MINKYLSQNEVINQIVEGANNHEKLVKYIHIPTGAASTEALLKQGGVTLGEITLTNSSLQVFNKIWLLEQCEKAGILAPITWQKITEISGYPVFYKQCYEKGGGVRGIAYSPKEIPKTDVKSLIFQELITGKGTYGVSFLADKGKMLASYSHFESDSLPKEGGSAVVIEPFDDKRLLDYTKRLLNSISYSGWGLAEYKYCPKRKDYVLMEINAKFWASCELAFINNPTFLKLLFNIDIKENPIKRLVFIDRAMQRGITFFIKQVIFNFRGTTFRLYSGWLTRLIISASPVWLYKKIKMLKNKN